MDTGASTIATGCPFCRVMITDGVDDVAAASDVEKAEVLDVAQLLLGSLDTSTCHAAREGHRRKGSRGARRSAPSAVEGRAAPSRGGRPRRRPQPAPKPRPRRPRPSPSPASASPAAPSVRAPRRPPPHAADGTKPAAAAARPPRGWASPAAPSDPAPRRPPPHPLPRPPPRPPSRPRPSPRSRAWVSPAVPSDPAPRRHRRRPAAAPAAPAAETPAEAPAKPEPEVKGLGIAGGAKRPGARKAPAKPAAPNEGAGTVVQPPNVDPDQAKAGTEAADTADSDRGLETKPEPEVKGLGIAAGARRPGAKKAPAAKPEPKAEPQPEAQPAAEDQPAAEAQPEPEAAAPSSNGSSDSDARVVGRAPGEGTRHRQGRPPPGQAVTPSDQQGRRRTCDGGLVAQSRCLRREIDLAARGRIVDVSTHQVPWQTGGGQHPRQRDVHAVDQAAGRAVRDPRAGARARGPAGGRGPPHPQAQHRQPRAVRVRGARRDHARHHRRAAQRAGLLRLQGHRQRPPRGVHPLRAGRRASPIRHRRRLSSATASPS